MNAKVAKKIRRLIFGDQSIRVQNYGIFPETGQLVCRGLRGNFKEAKRFYKAARRDGRPLPWIWQDLSQAKGHWAKATVM